MNERQEASTKAGGGAGDFRLRAAVLGLVLIPFNARWIQHSELVREAGQPTMASLYFTAVFTLLALTIVNAAVGKVRPAWALRRAELLLIYAVVSVGSSIAGHDQTQVLVPVMSYGVHHASPENRWASRVLPYMPSHLVVSDIGASRMFFEGGDLYTARGLKPWLRPSLWWLAFILVMGVVMVSLNLLLHPRWTANEKLSYPLIAIPEQVVELGFIRQRVFWLGFAIAASVDLMNGLHTLFPSVPHLRVTAHELLPVRDTRILQAFGYMPIAFYPFAIGLGLLLPTDFLLSCWVFFWVWKMENVVGAVAGLSQLPRFPYVSEQSFGAYLAIALFALWMARRHLARVVQRAFSRKGERRFRFAVCGFLAGFVALVAFGVRGGMTPWVATVYFALYLGLSIAIARMRGEMGVPAHDLHRSGPDVMLVNSLGPSNLRRGDLTMFAMFWWMTRAHRSHPMPHELEGLELGRRQGASTSAVVVTLLTAVGVGAVAGIWSMLALGSKYGLDHVHSDGTYFGLEAYSRLNAWLYLPQPRDTASPLAVVFGAGVVLAMMVARTRLAWWPFHPIGYAVSSSLSMHILWMPMLIAWMVKTAVLRYGGVHAFRRTVTFSMGLILGEFVAGSAWSLFGMAAEIPTYRFWSY